MLKGALTALITPFDQSNSIDERAFRNLVEWQIGEGINGLVPVGTTGESPTLSHEEHKKVIEICIDQTRGRVPVLAGAGSNNTIEAIELAQHAQKAGADGVLVVTPYYNKPNQRGLYAHFAAVASAITIPLVIYNIPGRSIVDMSVETMAKLANDYSNIVGVKDATGEVERASLQRIACPKGFIQLSGDDSTALGFNAQGGCGCISVTSNIAPRLCADLQAACEIGDFKKALELNERLMPLNRALFLEPSPSGVKYAAEKLGKIAGYVRKPIMPIEDETKEKIDSAMRYAALIA